MATLLRLRSGIALRLECAGCGGDGALTPLFSDEWLGTAVWPAARALISYLEEQQAALRLTALSVVELGSGTGACGLAAAALGAARVTLTDKSALLPTLQHNINLNSIGDSVVCRELTWSTTALPPDVLPHGADLVLMSDCLNVVYGDQHAPALASTLRCLLERRLHWHNRCGSPIGLLSQVRRGGGKAEAVFFAECERIGLLATLVSTCSSSSSSSSSSSEAEQDAVEAGEVDVSLYVLTIR
jgi:hypothetical protein